MNTTRTFTTFFDHLWSPAFEVFPIENAEGVLVGGYTVIDGPVWKCFIATRGYGESLAIGSPNSKLYVTPDIGPTGRTEKLTLSLVKISEESKLVNLEEE